MQPAYLALWTYSNSPIEKGIEVRLLLWLYSPPVLIYLFISFVHYFLDQYAIKFYDVYDTIDSQIDQCPVCPHVYFEFGIQELGEHCQDITHGKHSPRVLRSFNCSGEFSANSNQSKIKPVNAAHFATRKSTDQCMPSTRKKVPSLCQVSLDIVMMFLAALRNRLATGPVLIF